MKKLLLLGMLVTGIFSLDAAAQGIGKLRTNANEQPEWGPRGYDRADYYYFPDMEVYYNVPQKQYVYQESGKWKFSATLPAKYGKYDLYKSYKVVMNENKPYMHHNKNKTRYASYRGKKDQPVRRDQGRDDRNNDNRKDNNKH